MYEHMTADKIEQRMLGRVNHAFDRREGSIIYDATAPASIELAELYIMADVILKETFAKTASREFLKLRASEFNIYPEEATFAEVEGKFNAPVPLGSRFNFEEYNFIVDEVIDNANHLYKLRCESRGRGANGCIGYITPVVPVNGLTSAEIVKIITPGEDEEDTEVFRKRYFEALKSKAYGGNGADYKEKVLAIPGVGGVKVYRCWNGGGTVKLVITNSEHGVADSELIKMVQNKIDPIPQGKGYGIAPIGHTVTVVSAESAPLTINVRVTLSGGRTSQDLQPIATKAIESYLLGIRKGWGENDDRGRDTVRTAYIVAEILKLPNVIDVDSVTINGKSDKVLLEAHQIPTVGRLTLT